METSPCEVIYLQHGETDYTIQLRTPRRQMQLYLQTYLVENYEKGTCRSFQWKLRLRKLEISDVKFTNPLHAWTFK